MSLTNTSRLSRVFLVAALSAAPVANAQSVDVDLGGMVLSVSSASSAQVFHIVDQLSEWDQYAHKAYGRWAAKTLNFNDQDRRLLQQHAELRRARGWGKGFEQAFLVTDSIDAAATNAIAAGLLTSAEATTERNILNHFSPKVAALIEQQRDRIDAFRNQLVSDRATLTPLVQKLARFAEATSPIRVSVFLVANPEENSGGGGANGGRLVVEVPGPDSMGFLLHEALHVFLAPHAEAIRAAAASAGLSFQALNEGIAYALAPGLTDDNAQVDHLAETLARHLIRGTPASDAYVQSSMIASVVRPLLRASLDRGETLSGFLPKAASRWRTISPR
ncbi:MAG TPA: hypothetical protein VFO58_07510 [Vicinamibacterales bacterium]|nr:hypothetical protein [Vicinamibacterales bacterium]